MGFFDEDSLFENMDKNSLVTSLLQDSMINPRSVQPLFAEDIRDSFSGGLAKPRRIGRRNWFGNTVNLGRTRNRRGQVEDDDQW
jgi:hypothetical protein